MTKTILTVSVLVNATPETVWECYTNTQHIMNWNAAAETWHCPKASNELKVGGSFSFTMAAKDESFSFDFNGTYTNVDPLKQLEYTLEDGREVSVDFRKVKNRTTIEQSFEPESENTLELQLSGWQAILDNFKKYTESL